MMVGIIEFLIIIMIVDRLFGDLHVAGETTSPSRRFQLKDTSSQGRRYSSLSLFPSFLVTTTKRTSTMRTLIGKETKELRRDDNHDENDHKETTTKTPSVTPSSSSASATLVFATRCHISSQPLSTNPHGLRDFLERDEIRNLFLSAGGS